MNRIAFPFRNCVAGAESSKPRQSWRYRGFDSLSPGHPIVCLVLLALLAIPSAASAQKRRVPIENDNHAFRFILNSLGMEPLTGVDQLNEDRANKILIVFGETEILDSIPLMDFVKSGGALFVATDRTSPERLREDFGAQIAGNYHVKTDQDSGYRREAECPLIKPREDSEIARNLFSGPQAYFQQLATNRPSILILSRKTLDPLAFFPKNCWIDIFGIRTSTSLIGPFAAGAEIGNGRVLILADHSVFINSMMLQRDNDNFAFAYNCIDWLREGKEGKRTQVLFYDDNEMIPDFKVPIKTINEFPVPPVEVVNHLLANLENENIFNRLILGRNPERTFRMILRVLAVTFTVGLVLAGIYWLLQNRHRVEVKAPLFTKTAARLAPGAAVVALRHEALIKEDNFWEVGRDLARDWFADHYGSRSRPRVNARTSWWKRRALAQKVNELWKLAYGPPRKLSARHFAKVVADLDQVEAAWNNESLRWVE